MAWLRSDEAGGAPGRKGPVAVMWVVPACLALLGVAAMGQEKAVTLRAQRFELLDQEGKTIGVMGSEGGTFPFLELTCGGSQGSGGKVRIEVPHALGPRVSLWDANGKERLRMFLGGRLEVSETDPKLRFVGGQIPHIYLLDENGDRRAKFGSQMDESGAIELWDNAGALVFKASR